MLRWRHLKLLCLRRLFCPNASHQPNGTAGPTSGPQHWRTSGGSQSGRGINFSLWLRCRQALTCTAIFQDHKLLPSRAIDNFDDVTLALPCPWRSGLRRRLSPRIPKGDHPFTLPQVVWSSRKVSSRNVLMHVSIGINSLIHQHIGISSKGVSTGHPWSVRKPQYHLSDVSHDAPHAPQFIYSEPRAS